MDVKLDKLDSYWHKTVGTEVDFNRKVKVKFEDGSEMSFNYAMDFEDKVSYLILTEHCGYYEISKLGCKLSSKKMY